RGRRVLRHHYAAARGSRQRDAPRLAERKRRTRVGIDERLFDRTFVRLMVFDDSAQRFEEIEQARSELLIGARLDDAVSDMGQTCAIAQHHAPTAAIKAWVDAEDENAAHGPGLRRNPCQTANAQA